MVKKKTVKKKVTKSNKKKPVAKKKVTKKIINKKIAKKENSKLNKIMKGTKEDILIENFVGLQKAMTHLSIKFTELSGNISRLLNVFEESAKVLSKTEKEVDKTLSSKIDALLDQNKTLARGVNLMDNKMRRQRPPQQNFSRPKPQTSSFAQKRNIPSPTSNNNPTIPQKPKELPKI